MAEEKGPSLESRVARLRCHTQQVKVGGGEGGIRNEHKIRGVEISLTIEKGGGRKS